MENRSFSLCKNSSLLPVITERTLELKSSETWKLNKLQIINRNNSKSPLNRCFFFQNEPSRSDRISIKHQGFKSSLNFSKIRDKHLQDLDIDLDNQEMLFKKSEKPKDLEPLFTAYITYLDGITESVTAKPIKSALKRAKTGFNLIFKKLFPKIKQLDAEFAEKSAQTLMSIKPNKFSLILSKLGEIINEELSGTEKLEKYIQKNFILNRKKGKINTTAVQTDYKSNNDGVIHYEFKSYDQMERELESLRKINSVLAQEKVIMDQNFENLGDTKKLLQRNKVLESIVIKMRNSGLYQVESIKLNDDENAVFNTSYQ